jgi:hypothetical protein
LLVGKHRRERDKSRGAKDSDSKNGFFHGG